MDDYVMWMKTKVMGEIIIHRTAIILLLTNVKVRNIREQRK